MSGKPPGIEGSFLDPAVQSDPFPFYRQLHERCPVYRMPETGFYLVTKYDDVREVLTHPELFSNDTNAARGLQGHVSGIHQRILRERGWGHVQTLQRTDLPLHRRYRSLVNRVFTQRRVQKLAQNIDKVAHQLIDEWFDAGHCEFMTQFAIPMPGILIAEQLGLSRDEIGTFKRWADAMLAPATRLLTDEETVEVAEIELEAQHYLAKVFEERRARPRDDLISALVHAHSDGDDEEPLSLHELQNLMHQFITGGFETTTSAIGHGMWQLLRYPDQQALLRADRSLMKGFIEEALRFESPVQGLARRTTRDVELRGVTIPKDSLVVARYGAANRDEEKFENADRFDIRRENAATHVAFGLGTHFCIGAALARQEMRSAFTALLDRLDHVELDGPMPDPAHRPSMFFLPIVELRLRFR